MSGPRFLPRHQILGVPINTSQFSNTNWPSPIQFPSDKTSRVRADLIGGRRGPTRLPNFKGWPPTLPVLSAHLPALSLPDICLGIFLEILDSEPGFLISDPESGAWYVCVCVCNCLEDWALSLFYFYCGLVFTANQQFGVGWCLRLSLVHFFSLCDRW